MDRLINDFIHSSPVFPNLCAGIADFPWASFVKELDYKKLGSTPVLETRLGKMAEQLFEQCIEAHPFWNVVEKNIQINHEGRTLGELDFILNNQNGDAVHVELVYKLYLHFGEYGFIGPNNNDSLQRKQQHLQSHQFPLLHQKATKQRLSELDIDASQVTQRVLFLGQLFRPCHSLVSQAVPAEYIGDWVPMEALNLNEKSRFYLPQKTEWFIAPHDDVSWVESATIKEQLVAHVLTERSPLIWEMDQYGGFRKFFVTWFS